MKYNPNDKLHSFTLISPISQQPVEIQALFKGKTKGWYMRCECGSFRVYEPSHVKAGRITSCGCKRGANIQAKRDHTKGNDKRKETFKARYGVENAGQLPDNSLRQKKAWEENKASILEKRKRTGTLFSSSRFKESKKVNAYTYTVEDTGESLLEWYNRTSPEGSYQTYVRACRAAAPPYTETFLRATESLIKEGVSSLESYASKLLGVPLNRERISPEVPYRFDFKLSEKVFLNVDGLYWHCEEKVKPSYHYDMRASAEKAGLRLIQIREHELRNKPRVVKSIIDAVIGRTSHKLSARKCVVRSVSHKEAEGFYEVHHMMGSIKAKHIGLYTRIGVLVALISYKKKGNGIDISRFCSRTNFIVRGALSKLLKAVEKNAPEAEFIEYWVDLRYGDGKSVENLGYTRELDQKGGFSWTDFSTTYNRLRCATRARAQELGWRKIYDAGQRKYVKKLK